MTDDEILSIFVNADDPVLTATEIAEQTDLTRQAIRRRLQQLRDNDGVLERKNVGSRAVVWWLTDVGEKYTLQESD